jgi:hypothetical protein
MEKGKGQNKMMLLHYESWKGEVSRKGIGLTWNLSSFRKRDLVKWKYCKKRE